MYSYFLRLSATLLALAVGSNSQALPVVDLGTSVHQATYNANATYYTFSNIPYAEPPVGQLRFRLPIPSLRINRTVNDGSNPRICPQANAAFFGISVPYLLQTLFGVPPGSGGGGPPPTSGPPESEDCLLLDVSVPKAIWDAKATASAPVLVWIHGGGFAMGSKSGFNPTGLLAQARRNGAPGVIYVGINYRLGLFGFPPRQPWQWDVASNAGLYDQRLALWWVQQNIHLFGGDPSKVTVMGESAGGSSIQLQLTAFGGIDGASPFRRAIIQSPAVRPYSDAALSAQLYPQFLSAAGVSSMDAARNLPSAQLQAVNAAMVANASFATLTFGPTVDGVFIPAQPGLLLAGGLIDQSVESIVAHNLNEGLLFTDPRVSSQAEYKAFLTGLMPTAPTSKINYLATTVYPEDFSGAYPYRSQVERVTLTIAESVITCNAFGLGLAFNNGTRDYQFSIFPPVHAEDISYTFYNGEPVDGWGVPINATTARTFQNYFVDFAMKGTGAGSTALNLPVYTSQANTLNITDTGNTVVRDPAANSRCRYLLTGLFL